MKINGYDRPTAKRLVPLLRSIVSEICERRTEIARLEQRLRTLDKLRDQGPEPVDVRARLSAHRRELRLSTGELLRLGCRLDPFSPARVLIPGTSGTLTDGFVWGAEEGLGCGVALKVAV